VQRCIAIGESQHDAERVAIEIGAEAASRR
jgi:hypothetical protein